MIIHFPILIEYLSPHNLEPGSREGVDYVRYELIKNVNDLPIGSAIKILATAIHVRVK